MASSSLTEHDLRTALSSRGFPFDVALDESWHAPDGWPNGGLHDDRWPFIEGLSPLTALLQETTPDFALMEALIDHGADPGETGKNGALFRACMYPDQTRLSFLLAHGADPNQPWDCGELLLTELLHFRMEDAIFSLLFDYGADPTLPGEHGETPLAWASRHRPAGAHFRQLWLDSLARKEREAMELLLPKCAPSATIPRL